MKEWRPDECPVCQLVRRYPELSVAAEKVAAKRTTKTEHLCGGHWAMRMEPIANPAP